MKLGVREAARMLGVSETKVYRWVDGDEIPFVMIQHHPMFHRVELLEWAMEMELPVSADLYEDDSAQPLTAALERGGGRVLQDRLDSIASELPIEAAEREVVRAVIAAREPEMFVARAADWIAIPRPRSPIICHGVPPLVTLRWCGHRAILIDSTPVNAVFAIVAPTIRHHLALLSRLSLAVHDREFRTAAQRRDAFDDVIVEARRIELGLEASRPEASP